MYVLRSAYHLNMGVQSTTKLESCTSTLYVVVNNRHNKTHVTMTLDYVLKYIDIVLGPIKSCAEYFNNWPNLEFGPSWKEFSTKLLSLSCVGAWFWKVGETPWTSSFNLENSENMLEQGYSHGTLCPKAWISLWKVHQSWHDKLESHCFIIGPHSFRMLIEALRKLQWLYGLSRRKLMC